MTYHRYGGLTKEMTLDFEAIPWPASVNIQLLRFQRLQRRVGYAYGSEKGTVTASTETMSFASFRILTLLCAISQGTRQRTNPSHTSTQPFPRTIHSWRSGRTHNNPPLHVFHGKGVIVLPGMDPCRVLESLA